MHAVAPAASSQLVVPSSTGVSTAWWWRVPVAVLTGVTAVAAYGGAWYLTSDAPAREIPFAAPTVLPGGNWAFGGLALLVLVAAPMTIAALAAVTAHRQAPVLVMVAGTLLIGWIVVQVMLIGLVAALQPAMFLVGAVVLGLGMWGYEPR